MSSRDKLCRACLTAKESFTYILCDNVSADIYSYCTSIEIKREDDLPRSLCNVCYNLLSKFFDFKWKCIQSQNTLLNYSSVKTENEESMNLVIHVNSNIKVENDDCILEEDSPLADNGVDNCEVKEEVINVSVSLHEDNSFTGGNNDQIKSDFVGHEFMSETKQREKRIVKKIKLRPVAKVKRTKPAFNCELCNRVFKSSNSYLVHKLTHNKNETSLQCNGCSKTFMTPSGLRRHQNNSHTRVKLKNLKCEICGKILKSRESLQMHLKTHQERKLFVCDVCGRSYSTAYILRGHLETHKENRQRHYTCEHCGKKFFTNTMLWLHVSRRHSDRRYICEICSYPFTDKYNLAKHLLIHDGQKLFKCDICHKSYRSKGTLVEHKRMHSGERPYECSYCSKSFISKKRLTDHHRIHTGEKPHKCEICSQSFTQRGTLKRHMKVHDRMIVGK